MAVPVSKFSFTVEGLTFTFKDESANAPTAWLWKFGDDLTESVQNPIHEYDEEGKFTISLKVTNADGNNESSKEVIVTMAGITKTIKDLVKAKMPIGLTYDDDTFDTYLQEWMIYLQRAEKLSDEDVFKEWLWRPLTRLLLSNLILYSWAQKNQYSQFSVSAGAKGPLKSLETGPSKAEWHDPSTLLKVNAGGGELLVSDLCIQANTLGISLPMCPVMNFTALPLVNYPRDYYYYYPTTLIVPSKA